MAISVRLSVGGIHLVRSVGVRRFHRWGNWREGGCGSGGNAARGRDVAALAIAMKTEWWPRPWGDCLVDWTSIIDRIRYHWVLAFVCGTPTYTKISSTDTPCNLHSLCKWRLACTMSWYINPVRINS